MCGQNCRRTIGCPVSGSTRPVSSTHPVHCPTHLERQAGLPARPDHVRVLDARERRRADAAAARQRRAAHRETCTTSRASTRAGSGSARPVRPSTMPPNPKPTASARFRVTCHVGSSVPANRSPDRPPLLRRRRVLERRQHRPVTVEPEAEPDHRTEQAAARAHPAAPRTARTRARARPETRCASTRPGRPRSAATTAAHHHRRRTSSSPARESRRRGPPPASMRWASAASARSVPAAAAERPSRARPHAPCAQTRARRQPPRRSRGRQRASWSDGAGPP